MHRTVKYSYYPGCSMKTSAKENNASLKVLFHKLGIALIELDDWSCCGSSSAHSINTGLSIDMASRNLAIAPPDRPLMVACPSCTLRLKQTHLHIKESEELQKRFYELWGKKFNKDLKIVHFFEVMEAVGQNKHCNTDIVKKPLTGLKFVPYYGCMLARPPEMRHNPNYHGLMENILQSLGAQAVDWGHHSKCCGTFLSVAKPEAITPIINEIIQAGIDAGGDCIVTACSMCQLNLEIRCNLKKQIPTMHFTELISLALGTKQYKKWFAKHLVDPTNLLEGLGLIP